MKIGDLSYLIEHESCGLNLATKVQSCEATKTDMLKTYLVCEVVSHVNSELDAKDRLQLIDSAVNDAGRKLIDFLRERLCVNDD